MRDDEHPRDPDALEPLHSQLPDDAELADLVAFFIGDLQRHIDAIERAWSENERDELRTLAHQLRGAGTGYGYPDITEQAAALERLVQSTETDASAIGEQVEALIHLCRRARRGGPQRV